MSIQKLACVLMAALFTILKKGKQHKCLPIDKQINKMSDWFQIGKGVRQGCILSPCLFNLYAGYIMRNTGLEEAQAGIKIAGRNTNNLRYAGNTTLMAESEEELKLKKRNS